MQRDAITAKLKTATRLLVAACGNGEGAATATRVSRQMLDRYREPSLVEHAPIDVIADLETACGNPIVTRALCELAGGQFFPNLLRGSTSLVKRLSKVSSSAGKTVSDTIDALEDGEIDAVETARLLEDLTALRQVVTEAIVALESGGV